ncbi:hypothetical protein ON010_g5588 [Phytophthora cinnamomi]|nr:hypothetical protein ON010_g5588 [Phytophthora cinnamomi]
MCSLELLLRVDALADGHGVGARDHVALHGGDGHLELVERHLVAALDVVEVGAIQQRCLLTVDRHTADGDARVRGLHGDPPRVAALLEAHLDGARIGAVHVLPADFDAARVVAHDLGEGARGHVQVTVLALGTAVHDLQDDGRVLVLALAVDAGGLDTLAAMLQAVPLGLVHGDVVGGRFAPRRHEGAVAHVHAIEVVRGAISLEVGLLAGGSGGDAQGQKRGVLQDAHHLVV